MFRPVEIAKDDHDNGSKILNVIAALVQRYEPFAPYTWSRPRGQAHPARGARNRPPRALIRGAAPGQARAWSLRIAS